MKKLFVITLVLCLFALPAYGQLYFANVQNQFLQRPAVASPAGLQVIGPTPAGVRGLACMSGSVYCATADNRLWMRSAGNPGAPWAPVGMIPATETMTAGSGYIFYLNTSYQLFCVAATALNTPWIPIGMAPAKAKAMTYYGGNLYLVTKDNRLFVRKATMTPNKLWNYIGPGPGLGRVVMNMACYQGHLYAVTHDNNFWACPANVPNAPWQHIGTAAGIVGMTVNQ